MDKPEVLQELLAQEYITEQEYQTRLDVDIAINKLSLNTDKEPSESKSNTFSFSTFREPTDANSSSYTFKDVPKSDVSTQSEPAKPFVFNFPKLCAMNTFNVTEIDKPSEYNLIHSSFTFQPKNEAETKEALETLPQASLFKPIRSSVTFKVVIIGDGAIGKTVRPTNYIFLLNF